MDNNPTFLAPCGGGDTAGKNVLVYLQLLKLECALSRDLVQMQILFGEVWVEGFWVGAFLTSSQGL